MAQSIKNINFKSAALAGFVAGYLMFFIDQKLGGFLGLFGMFDPVASNWKWLLTHHIDSIIFALPFAWPVIYNKLPGSGWLKGIVYGFLWWLVFLFIVGMIAAPLGAKFFQQMQPGSAAGLITAILLHLFYGFFLGVLYNPPENVSTG